MDIKFPKFRLPVFQTNRSRDLDFSCRGELPGKKGITGKDIGYPNPIPMNNPMVKDVGAGFENPRPSPPRPDLGRSNAADLDRPIVDLPCFHPADGASAIARSSYDDSSVRSLGTNLSHGTSSYGFRSSAADFSHRTSSTNETTPAFYQQEFRASSLMSRQSFPETPSRLSDTASEGKAAPRQEQQKSSLKLDLPASTLSQEIDGELRSRGLVQ